jgi:hypothetical protein
MTPSKVFSARELMATTGAIDVSLWCDTPGWWLLSSSMLTLPQDDRLRSISAEIKTAKGRIKEICDKKVVQESGNSERIQYFLHALRVYQAEFSTQLREWAQLSQEVDVRLHLKFGVAWVIDGKPSGRRSLIPALPH